MDGEIRDPMPTKTNQTNQTNQTNVSEVSKVCNTANKSETKIYDYKTNLANADDKSYVRAVLMIVFEKSNIRDALANTSSSQIAEKFENNRVKLDDFIDILQTIKTNNNVDIMKTVVAQNEEVLKFRTSYDSAMAQLRRVNTGGGGGGSVLLYSFEPFLRNLSLRELIHSKFLPPLLKVTNNEGEILGDIQLQITMKNREREMSLSVWVEEMKRNLIGYTNKYEWNNYGECTSPYILFRLYLIYNYENKSFTVTINKIDRSTSVGSLNLTEIGRFEIDSDAGIKACKELYADVVEFHNNRENIASYNKQNNKFNSYQLSPHKYDPINPLAKIQRLNELVANWNAIKSKATLTALNEQLNTAIDLIHVHDNNTNTNTNTNKNKIQIPSFTYDGITQEIVEMYTLKSTVKMLRNYFKDVIEIFGVAKKTTNRLLLDNLKVIARSVNTELLRLTYGAVPEVLYRTACRLENAETVCEHRIVEGKFINRSLADVRGAISDMLQEKQRHSNLNIAPSVVPLCHDAYCHVDEHAVLKCYKLPPKNDRKPNSIIFEHILEEIYPDPEKKMRDSDRWALMYRELIVCVFCVFNISKDVNTNNPPPVPYVDINAMRRRANQFNFDGNIVEEYAVLLEKIRSFTDKTESLLTSIEYEDINRQMSDNERMGTRKTNIPFTKNLQRQMNAFLHTIDNNNAASAIGTLEFVDRLAKFNTTNVTCVVDKFDVPGFMDVAAEAAARRGN
jgi:hypothetical protein